MRLPVLHKSLPISKAPGLSDLLVGSALLTDALQKSGIHDDLYVIT
ncbi:MAG: capsular biosynthesis protein, partial [Sutterella sp.]|nr:capsular biosynthesis protein [Sutterella sp.]